MTTKTTTAAQILAAAQKMHDAADDLQELLATAGAVHARILLQSLSYVRRGADDLEQFASDLAEDQRTALDLEDAGSMAEEVADKAKRRASDGGKPVPLADYCNEETVFLVHKPRR